MRAPSDSAIELVSVVCDRRRFSFSDTSSAGARSEFQLTPHCPPFAILFARLILTLCALLFALCPAFGQQEPESPSRPANAGKTDYSTLGYLRFVNATGHDGKLHVLLDGQDTNPPGYPDKTATGSVGFPPRTFQIEMRHDILGEFKLTVTLKPGEVTSVIALPVIRPEKEGADGVRDTSEKAPKVELGAHAITSPGYVRGKDLSVTVLQATIAEKLEVKIGNLPLICPKLDPATVSLGKGIGENVPVSVGENKLISLNFVDPSDRVVIVFPNKDGVLQTITLNNEVF